MDAVVIPIFGVQTGVLVVFTVLAIVIRFFWPT
jgi:hypothetical protein